MNLRYEITPQIKDYDLIGESFRPHLMRFDNPNKNFRSVSTNEHGFRNSIDMNGNVIDHSKIFSDPNNSFSIMLGSSSVFGVGATSDAASMPSLLSNLRSENWLNFGGRAYNSTQELILLSLHLHAKPNKIIIFSGVNNLTLAYLSEKTSDIYNSFFGESSFRKALSTTQNKKIGVRRSFLNLMDEIYTKFCSHRNMILTRTNKDISSDYNNILKCFQRDLFCAKAIADGHGSQITFVLQPLATWIDKKLSNEESRLFEFLDSLNNDWKVLSEYLGLWKDRYFEDIERICTNLGVTFINLNCEEFRSSDWLFVDRVHLTDNGYKLAANLINGKIHS